MFIAYIYCDREFLKDYLLGSFSMANPDITLYFHDCFAVFLFLRKAAEFLFLVVVIVHFLHCSSYFDVLIFFQVFWHAASSSFLPGNPCLVSWCMSLGMIFLTPTELVVNTAMVSAIRHVDTMGDGQYLRDTCYKVGKLSHCFLYSW